MSSVRNVLLDPATTHTLTGLLGAGAVLGVLALRKRSRTDKGRTRALEIGLPIPADVLGAMSDEEYALLKDRLNPRLPEREE